MSVIPHHVRIAGLHEWELNCATASGPKMGSSISFKNKDASAVVMGDTDQVPLLSFQEGKKLSPVSSLIWFSALTKHSPQDSSKKNLRRAVNGRSLVLASLLFEVLCLDVSASTSTRSPDLSVQRFSSLAKSDHLAAAKIQNKRAPEIAERRRFVLLVQIISSAFTAATVS